MKILFVTPSMGYGGSERIISILSNSFAERGHKVKILMTNKNKECVYQLNESIKLENINPLDIKKPKMIYKHIKSLRINIKEYQPNIIISFMKDTCALTCISNLGLNYPIIFSERADPFNVKKSIKNDVYKFLVESFISGCIFQSEGAKYGYSKRVREKSSIILNPFNEEILPKEYNGIRRKEIVSVGRLEKHKNQKMLINAFAKIVKKYPDYKLLIYGNGSLRNELQSQIDILNLSENIKLMGTRENILEEINGASLYAFTSDYEGLPNALIEAMALGLPCISTDFSPGSASMLIENNINGILIPVGDEGELVKQIDIMLSNPLRSYNMGQKAKKIINKVNLDAIINEWELYITNIINQRDSRYV